MDGRGVVIELIGEDEIRLELAEVVSDAFDGGEDIFAVGLSPLCSGDGGFRRRRDPVDG